MTAPPTPAEAYQSFGTLDDSQFAQPVLRFPVVGPVPLNTLATFTVPLGNIRWGDTDSLSLSRAAYITGLTINGYDPGRPENLGLMQSCVATLNDVRIDDNATFTAAVDGVAVPDPLGHSAVEIRGWDVDDRGRFKVMVYQGHALDDSHNTLHVSEFVRCWVLFYEPAPPPPDTPEELATRAAALRASQQVAAYRQYVTLQEADLWKATHELTTLARELEAASWTDEAIEVHELIVTSVEAYLPPADLRLDYLLFLAGQRQNLIARLLERDRAQEARDLGAITVTAYTDYYNALPAADRAEVVRVRLDPDLIQLQRQLFNAGLRAEPVQALELLVTAFRGSVRPAPGADRLDFDIKFAEARHDLIARLVDNQRRPEAKALVIETIDAYRTYAAEPGANRVLAVSDLTDLARVLGEARLPTESDAAKQAAAALGVALP